MEGKISLMAVGDVGPIHEPIASYGELVRDTLAVADIRVGQVERVYSDRGAYQIHSSGRHSRVKPSMASVFSDCAFNVVSVASNHAMDWGPDAMLDSIDLFHRMDIKTVGAGRNLKDARRPVIIERNGVRTAFLAYCSVLKEGYAATADTAGVAPLRAHTYYAQEDYQAGVPPKVVTLPYEEDLYNMVEDITAVRKHVHAVVLILHWGVHFIPRLIADYQKISAKSAFAAGADLIVGHHAHVPKAIECNNGKACFYSLSNFIMSGVEKSGEAAARFERMYGVKLDPDYPRLPYGADGQRSLVAKALVSVEGVREVSFLPIWIDKQLRPEILLNGDPRFDDMVRYMKWASEDFKHQFLVRGNEVLVSSNTFS